MTVLCLWGIFGRSAACLACGGVKAFRSSAWLIWKRGAWMTLKEISLAGCRGQSDGSRSSQVRQTPWQRDLLILVSFTQLLQGLLIRACSESLGTPEGLQHPRRCHKSGIVGLHFPPVPWVPDPSARTAWRAGCIRPLCSLICSPGLLQSLPSPCFYFILITWCSHLLRIKTNKNHKLRMKPVLYYKQMVQGSNL